MKTVIFALLTSATTLSHASNWIIPEGYKNKEILPNGDRYIVSEDNGNLIFAFKKNNQSSDTLWMTKCFKTTQDGIPLSTCLVQQANVVINDIRSPLSYIHSVYYQVLLFGTTESKNISYRIDKKPIVTVNDDFIMRGESPTILKDILKGKKLTFAYKLNQSDFLSAQIDLSGLKENIDFANAVIKTNE